VAIETDVIRPRLQSALADRIKSKQNKLKEATQ